MRSTIRKALFLAATIVPAVALGGEAGIKYTDEPARLPPDGSLPDTSSVDADLFDIDGDGDLDVFIAEGTASLAGRPNRLLVNDGTGTFTDESAARLPSPNNKNSSRSDEGDVDGDGDLDLVIANVGPEDLYLNDGSGHFTNASAQLPPPPFIFDDISSEARFIDVDGDGDLDILVANENPFAPGPLQGAQDRLWINDGTAHFTDETAARLPLVPDQTGGYATGDLDGDGDTDIIVINRGQDRVFVNDGNGFFTEDDARLGVTTDTSRAGVLADLDEDGDLDLLVANSRGEPAARYQNDGTGFFAAVEVSPDDFPHETLTSVEVGDIDHDGDLDVVFGNAGPFVSGHGFTGGQDSLLRNDGHGKLHDRTAHALPVDADPTLDAAFGDVDGDGDLDLVFANSGGPERIAIQKGD